MPRVALLILAGCVLSLSACDPTISTTIVPKEGTVGSSLLLEDAEDLQVVPLPNDSYAVVRTNPEGRGYVVEGYDRGLAPIWKYVIPFDRLHQVTPIWLSGNEEAVTLLNNRYEYNDTITIMGMILDPLSGTLRETRALTGIRFPLRHSETSATILVASPDSTLFSFYHYDYTDLEEDGSKTVGLVAELFDTKLNHRGSTRVAIPVPDHVDDEEEADWWVQTFFLSNEGFGYQVSYHGTSTLRITQIDFVNKSERMLEKEIPLVDFYDGRPLIGTAGWSGAGGKVIVASNIARGKYLEGVILAGMDFSRNSVEFISSREINRTIVEPLQEDDELEGFRIRQVIRMPGGEIVLPLDQVVQRTYTNAKNGYSYTVTSHRDLMILGFDHQGKTLWSTLQKHSWEEERTRNFRADSWSIAKDSIHYIYKSSTTNRNAPGISIREYATGSISTRTGAMTPPRPLLVTEMRAEQQYTLWLGRGSVMLALTDEDDMRLVRVEF